MTRSWCSFWTSAALLSLIAACAATQPVRPSLHPQTEEVLSELSRRSAMNESDLSAVLSNCQASSQSRYLCAFRDYVAIDLAFKQLVETKLHELPACTVLIKSHVEYLERMRDESCMTVANEPYSEASMALTAETKCAAHATAALIPQLQRLTHCGSRAVQ
jgi:hypothetical protein